MEDLNQYRGMTRKEANRQIAEDKRRALYQDPRYKAVVRQGERERAAREAEAEQRRRREEEQREAEAKRQLAAEKERQKRIWISSGNPSQEFEAAWPRIKQEVLMERTRAFLERAERDSVV
jgi:hypothetical protein